MAWSHSADTTGSFLGTAWTPEAAAAAAASDTADDVALQRAAIPKAPSGDGDALLHPNSAARAAHPTPPCTRENRTEKQKSDRVGSRRGLRRRGLRPRGACRRR